MPSLFVLTAAAADRAVILRRGPSKWFHVIGWDTRRDRFEHGAWIKGHLDRTFCDLSPDGELLLAAVRQYAKRDTPYTTGWAAVSRVPWLAAVALWPNRHSLNAGGWFEGPRTVVLRTTAKRPPDWHLAHPPRGLTVKVASLAENPPARHDELAPGADWSGRDYRGGIIYARGPRLFRSEEGQERLIADFTDLTPDPQPAPDWAGRPL